MLCTIEHFKMSYSRFHDFLKVSKLFPFPYATSKLDMTEYKPGSFFSFIAHFFFFRTKQFDTMLCFRIAGKSDFHIYPIMFNHQVLTRMYRPDWFDCDQRNFKEDNQLSCNQSFLEDSSEIVFDVIMH